MEAWKVILIGGTSHAGKSTLAQSIGQRLGWDVTSTDRLARHPGRPWKTVQRSVPPHVADHYSSLSVEALLADVLHHYQRLWPTVCDIVLRPISTPSARGLVLEGSALWPVWAASLDAYRSRAVWLTASDDFLQQRIYIESRFSDATEPEKALIRKFVDRTLLYNQRMMEEVRKLGLLSLNVENESSPDHLPDALLALMQKPGASFRQR